MNKFIVAAGTFGILAIGGILNANAQTYGPAPGVMVYEGRNVYGPRVYEPAPFLGGPTYYYEGYTNREQAYNTQWTQPGDAAILNQERANERSRR